MEAMDGMVGLLWECQQNYNFQFGADELRQKLYWATLELENVRAMAEEEMRKNEDNARQILELMMHQKQLLQMLQITAQERDEARYRLQKLLDGLVPIEASPPMASNPQHENPSVRLQTICGNSSITEPDCLSGIRKHPPHASSSSCSSAAATPPPPPPIDSSRDAASSPDLSSIHHLAADSSTVTSGKGTTLSMPVPSPSGPTKCDRASMVLDHFLTNNKPLPEKGKLLQAVMEAGPLLETLLLAGPLPRWRNPPPLRPLETPPISVNECDARVLLNAGGVGSAHHAGQDYSSAFPPGGSFGTPQVYAASAVSFTGPSGSSCVGQRPPWPPCVVGDHHRS